MTPCRVCLQATTPSLFTFFPFCPGTLLASACRATASEHAKIILWDTTTWLEVGALLGHNLSVTQIAFSPDDRYIATGSRDRQVCVFERDPLDETGRTYKLESCLAKAHARIIW